MESWRDKFPGGGPLLDNGEGKPGRKFDRTVVSMLRCMCYKVFESRNVVVEVVQSRYRGGAFVEELGCAGQ